MFTLNGSPISIDRPFTAPDGTKYANLRDASVRQALGVTEVADPPYFDQRFYWGVGNPKLLNDREEVDEDGNPIPDQEYILYLSNGEVRKGKLDGSGYKEEKDVPPVPGSVRFPKLPGFEDVE